MSSLLSPRAEISCFNFVLRQSSSSCRLTYVFTRAICLSTKCFLSFLGRGGEESIQLETSSGNNRKLSPEFQGAQGKFKYQIVKTTSCIGLYDYLSFINYTSLARKSLILLVIFFNPGYTREARTVGQFAEEMVSIQLALKRAVLSYSRQVGGGVTTVEQSGPFFIFSDFRNAPNGASVLLIDFSLGILLFKFHFSTQTKVSKCATNVQYKYIFIRVTLKIY